MSTPARIVLILLGLIVLVVGGAAAFVLTLDPERYRDDIVRLVRDNTGLDVRLDGPIEFSLWPTIALSVENAAADWSDAGTEPLVAVRRVAFEAALLPLLSGSPRLEADRVTLEGVALDLRVDADGTDNWSPPGSGDADPAPAPAPAPDDDGTSVQVDADVQLDRFEILDLAVRYRDATSDTDVQVSGLDFIGILRDPDNIDLALSGRATVAGGPDVTFDGDLGVDLEGPEVDFRDVTADVVLPDVREPLAVRLRGRARMDQDADELTLDRLELSVAELIATVDGRIADVTGTQNIDLKARIAPTDLRALLARFDAVPAMQGADTLRRLAADLSVQGSAEDLRIADLNLQLDALRIAGSARVRPEAVGGRMAIDFDLDAGRLELTPYLPPATDAPAPEPAAGPLVTDEPLDLAVLREIDLDGEIRASAIVLPQITTGAARITVDNAAGRLQASIDVRELLGGAINLVANVNAAEATPTVGLAIDADALAAARVLPGAGFTGPLGLDGRIDASGASTAALARSARGRIQIGGSGGTLDVKELKASLLSIATLLGQGPRITAWPDTLGYQSLAGTWSLNGGLGEQALQLAIDNLRIDGTGGIDLQSGDFGFRFGALFAAATPRTFDVPPEIDGIRLPARCTGNLTDPGNPCGFDQKASGELVAQVLQSKAGAALRQRLSEQIPDDAPAAQLIRGLLGGQPAAPAAEGEQPASSTTPAPAQEAAQQLLRGIFGTPRQQQPSTSEEPPPR